MRRRKYTVEIIKSLRESFEFLEDEYKGYLAEHKFKCKNGHIFKMRFDSFISGSECPLCNVINRKNDFKIVKLEFKRKGFKVLDRKYISARDKLLIICKKNHLQKISYDHLRLIDLCKYCKRLNTKMAFLKKFKKEVELRGFKLLSTIENYIFTYSKLKFECPRGHIYSTRHDIFKAGFDCPVCRYIKHSIRFTGEKNPSWKGGISCEPYCEIWVDNEYKESIKERDGYRCLNPECNKNNEKLCIHHIDYNKKNCHPLNLITLCFSCNGKANKDREWHKSWYQAIIYRRYIIKKGT